MTAAKPISIESPTLEKMHDLIPSAGPCLTLFVPPYHPGEPAKSGSAVLKSNIREAAEELAHRRIARAGAEGLLEPLHQLAHDPVWATGSHSGCAILRSPEVFCQFPLMQPPKPSLTVGGCFAVRRLLAELWTPKLFYILALCKESVSLFRCADAQAQAVQLPGGTPMTLLDAMGLDAPDHDLENRAAAGAASGNRRRIRFGTGSGRETEQAHLADFYKLVDRAIHRLIHEPGIPLILAGVEEDAALYRAVSSYRDLARERLPGATRAPFPDPETMPRAVSLLRAQEALRQAEALQTAIKRTASNLVATDPHAIVHAAFDGRVRELYLREGAEIIGVFERRSYRSCGAEDLLNLAAAETLLHRGKAFELPATAMPNNGAAVAILRY